MLLARLGLVLLLAATSYHASMVQLAWCWSAHHPHLLSPLLPSCSPHWPDHIPGHSERPLTGLVRATNAKLRLARARVGQHKESDPLSQVRLGRRKVVWDWSRGHPCSR